MDFKLIVEEALNEHGDVYTLDEITKSSTSGGFSNLEAGARKMKIIQRFLKREGYYKLGIRGLVADIEPRNEIEQKAKEILKENPELGFYELLSKVEHWIADNLPRERKIELYTEYEQKRWRSPQHTAVKILFFGLIVVPYTKIDTQQNYEQRQKLLDGLIEGIKNLKIGIAPRGYNAHYLREDVRQLGVTQFKVYKEYDLDKETEQSWGDIASEL